MERLHIEGPDSAKLMGIIDGMGTLRITDNEGHMVDVTPATIMGQRFYHGSGRAMDAEEIVMLNLDPRCYYVRHEVVRFEYPKHESLYCSLRAAMRGLGWTGLDHGSNSISPEAFLRVLWRHVHVNELNIRYIETA